LRLPDNIRNGDSELIDQLRPSWLLVFESLKRIVPSAVVTGRLRPDTYGIQGRRLVRDSAGVRVVTADIDMLEAARKAIGEVWKITQVRDFLQGHPRSSYYRGVHLYVRNGIWEIEVQLRTQRQHLIAEWAHDRIFLPTTPDDWKLVYDAQVATFLEELSSHYDALDRNRIPESLPRVPRALLPYATSLGLSSMNSIDGKVGDD
jgi:RelA/SpoT family protein